MFQFEKEMIPVLRNYLSHEFKTQYFATEFNSGNGVADLVFTTELNEEELIFNDYGLMSLFINNFYKKKKLSKKTLFDNCLDKKKLQTLLHYLLSESYFDLIGNNFIELKTYRPHTENLISIEAKLKDWKSGFHQALRYQFFSDKTFLAFPSNYIHRVDVALLKKNNIGLISVQIDGIEIILNPKEKKPLDLASYYFLSETFAKKCKSQPYGE